MIGRCGLCVGHFCETELHTSHERHRDRFADYFHFLCESRGGVCSFCSGVFHRFLFEEVVAKGNKDPADVVCKFLLATLSGKITLNPKPVADPILFGRRGAIWPFSENRYFVLVTSANAASRYCGVTMKRGEEHGFVCSAKAARMWLSRLAISKRNPPSWLRPLTSQKQEIKR